MLVQPQNHEGLLGEVQVWATPTPESKSMGRILPRTLSRCSGGCCTQQPPSTVRLWLLGMLAEMALSWSEAQGSLRLTVICDEMRNPELQIAL